MMPDTELAKRTAEQLVRHWDVWSTWPESDRIKALSEGIAAALSDARAEAMEEAAERIESSASFGLRDLANEVRALAAGQVGE